jgi:hypothetical protein
VNLISSLLTAIKYFKVVGDEEQIQDCSENSNPSSQGSQPTPSEQEAGSGDHTSPSDAQPKLDRPSEYLRARCLLCFGGKEYCTPAEM